MIGSRNYDRLMLWLSPLALFGVLLTSCGTFEVGIEQTSTPTPSVEGSADSPLLRTPTPVPSDYVPPTPEPALTPMPVGRYPVAPELVVAFVKDGDIWLWTEGDRSASPLTDTGDVMNSELKISDDGTLVAFRRDDGLWVARADGAGETHLLDAADLDIMRPNNSRLERYEWVPRSHNLAFNTYHYEGSRAILNDDLRLVNADSGEIILLLPPGSGGRFYYSPDGRQVALVTRGDISLIDADGSNRRESVLTYTPVEVSGDYQFYVRPAWAADGSGLRVAIPPATAEVQPVAPTTIWHIPVDGSAPSLIADIALFPADAPVAFSRDLEYVAYLRLEQTEGGPENLQLLLRVKRLEDGGWVEYADVVAFYGWAPGPYRFAFWSGRQVSQLLIGQWSGPTVPGSIDAGVPVQEVRWINDDEYLFLAGRNWEMGAEGDSFDIVLGNIDGSSTILASTDDYPVYDFWVLPEEVEPPEPVPTLSMKGYELYSWQVEGSWYFSLLLGTNRVKSYDEVTSPAVRVRGLTGLAGELDRLPSGEQVFWLAQQVPDTPLPPQEMVDEVVAYCAQRGIQLEIVE